ncbi:ParB/RepB/Spo0J family partition protein [Nitrosospira sp. Nsp13]|uniref:ParB/RepB/Spo0J family partition protein n=1 Tax=Nitrosospira sp. Nsp13 TaxID=1855332 RepID=UPI00087F2BB4|nr:ParB/RepB/Spo0J family partition protein [Nitrosospira sp. Nsp13]SCY53759.1 ParB family protein [Nitrosospira sp. Nsp13]
MAKADTKNTRGIQTKSKSSLPATNPGEALAALHDGPRELPLDLIDEDPYQPRTVFDKQLLEELAETIRQRGVKNPISVRRHPEKPGRYIINDGARRFRASQLIYNKTIKAFIDPDFTKIDQIIVNAHHADFTPREWAILIDQEEKKGKTKTQIAKELGKSSPFVTYYTTLLNLPDPIADVFNSGRCEDVTALNHLVIAWKRYPAEVEFWLEDQTVEITRASIGRLRAFLDSRRLDEITEGTDAYGRGGTMPAKDRKTRVTSPLRLHKPIVQVRVDGRIAHLLFSRRPSRFGMAWVKYEGDEIEKECAMSEIEFLGLLEGV